MEKGILKINYSMCAKMKYSFISYVYMHETDHYKKNFCLNKLLIIFNLYSGETLLYIRISFCQMLILFGRKYDK